MKYTKLTQRGAGHLVLLMVVVVVAVAGFVGYRVMSAKPDNKPTSANTKTNEKPTAIVWPIDEKITWQAGATGDWITLPYDSKPPACPDPLELNVPTTNVSEITSILYPGQTRQGEFNGLGGTYKAHGGFRFDKKTDHNVDVVMPFNGSVWRAARLTVEGEIQYGFDIVNACGVMIRLGHLRELTPAFQAIADKLPAAIEGDSRATKVLPMVAFKTGDKIATAVGLKNSKNVGFDYGVYDLRKDNQASKDPDYKAAHADTGETSFHGLCWPNNLSAKDAKIIKALPGGDQVAGKTSDYCK